MNWLTQLFTRRRRYNELSETIREHLDERIADLMDRGISREKAEQTARREFGNLTRIEERSRKYGSGLLSNRSKGNGHMDYRVAIGTPGHRKPGAPDKRILLCT